MSDAGPIRSEGFAHLEAPWRTCDIRKGQFGCGRVSCSWGAAIFICAKDVEKDIEIMCSEVSQMARRVMDTCMTNDKVMGAIWDKQERFTVEIFHSHC